MLKFRTDEDRALYEQITAECDQFNPVKQSIVCHAFVSRSKGRRNGKQRIRRSVKEVQLVSHYRQFYQLHRAPLDEWVTEVYEGNFNPFIDADYLREQIKTEFGL
jgi:hypothetical protein